MCCNWLQATHSRGICTIVALLTYLTYLDRCVFTLEWCLQHVFTLDRCVFTKTVFTTGVYIGQVDVNKYSENKTCNGLRMTCVSILRFCNSLPKLRNQFSMIRKPWYFILFIIKFIQNSDFKLGFEICISLSISLQWSWSVMLSYIVCIYERQ